MGPADVEHQFGMLPGKVCLTDHHRLQMVSDRLRGHMLGLGGGALTFMMMDRDKMVACPPS